MSRFAELLTIAATFALAFLIQCAETPAPPHLTRVEIYGWTTTVDRQTGEPAHRLEIHFRSADGAWVQENFIARERDHARFANAFYACIDEKVWPRELQPCE